MEVAETGKTCAERESAKAGVLAAYSSK